MQITRKDIGYTIYSRLEESIRSWLGQKLLNLFGNDWHSYIPEGVLAKAQESLSLASTNEVDDPVIVLDETDMPDLMEIICYRKAFSNFIPQEVMAAKNFRNEMIKL